MQYRLYFLYREFYKTVIFQANVNYKRPITGLVNARAQFWSTYLPWFDDIDVMPKFPIIDNDTMTLVKLISENKRIIKSFKADWRTEVINGSEMWIKKYHQFCRSADNTIMKISEIPLEKDNSFCQNHSLISSSLKTEQEIDYIIGRIGLEQKIRLKRHWDMKNFRIHQKK